MFSGVATIGKAHRSPPGHTRSGSSMTRLLCLPIPWVYPRLPLRHSAFRQGLALAPTAGVQPYSLSRPSLVGLAELPVQQDSHPPGQTCGLGEVVVVSIIDLRGSVSNDPD